MIDEKPDNIETPDIPPLSVDQDRQLNNTDGLSEVPVAPPVPMNKLTADEIHRFETLSADEKAAAATFNAAMAFHGNRTAELNNFKGELWADVMERFGLDSTKTWTLVSDRGFVEVVEQIQPPAPPAQ